MIGNPIRNRNASVRNVSIVALAALGLFVAGADTAVACMPDWYYECMNEGHYSCECRQLEDGSWECRVCDLDPPYGGIQCSPWQPVQ